MIRDWKIGHDNEIETSSGILSGMDGFGLITQGEVNGWNNWVTINTPQTLTNNVLMGNGDHVNINVDNNNRVDTNSIQFVNERYQFLNDKLFRVTMLTNRRPDNLGRGNVLLPTTYEHRIMMIFRLNNQDIPLLHELMDSTNFNRPIDYKSDAIISNYNNQSNYSINGLFISCINHLPLIDYNHYGNEVDVHVDFSCDNITIL